MSDALFSALEVETSTPARAGYRLDALEVFNWGTFDSRVWSLEPGGETSLLTGDIGSGKSTLVDAVTTLLLPAHRIAYNKAAGAEAKERTLRSYVQGYYKAERNESTGKSRPIGLRDDHTAYSVILGVFVNEGYGEEVTLAQVFHQRDRTGQPDRFYVTADRRLSITRDFTDFGSDLTALRRRLRTGGAEISTTFPDYGRKFRRLLGIGSEQAMELFHQTVSMKSVGNLNEFVRSHMLEPVAADDRIAAIIDHFEDLTKAHESVRRAREQLEALDPLVAAADRYDDTLARRHDTERQRDAVRLFFTELRISLLAREIEESDRSLATHEDHVTELSERDDALARERESLIADRAAAGGDRLGVLEREIERQRDDASRRRSRREQFDAQVAGAGFDPVGDESAMATLRGRVTESHRSARDDQRRLNDELVEVSGRRKEVEHEQIRVEADLESLRRRGDNLPRAQLSVRAELCRALELEPADLPFVGELVDVLADRDVWRGAAERVLRGFALSLLVPQDHYTDVARWVNDHKLVARDDRGRERGQRLVYERVPHRHVAFRSNRTEDELLLCDVLELAPSPFEGYLRDQLARRADHLCAESLDAFRAAPRAVTKEGQVRSGDRHEKDDRSGVDDPRTWVLGWTNERKVAAWVEHLDGLARELAEIQGRLADHDRTRERVDERIRNLDLLRQYDTWRDLAWEEAEAARADAAQERDRLLAGSSVLAEVDRALQRNSEQQAQTRDLLQQHRDRISVLGDRIQRARQTREQEEGYVQGLSDVDRAAHREAYDSLRSGLLDQPTTPDECQRAMTDLTAELQGTIERLGRELGGHSNIMVGQMHTVLNRWPHLATDLDATPESRAEFRDLRNRVAEDDLPSFEQEFKTQLNTNTIRELAGFNGWLRRQAEEIHDRVATINEALGAINYNEGRYIRLEAERTPNQEIQQFRSDLRQATDDTLGDSDDRYSEQRFAQVQQIIARFRGRDAHADTDKAWTRRVTDVRNWFTFAASERLRDTDEEWEHYSDSDGKSGGQKEKLAYTILAASLAYQFGLSWGVDKARDFRFAVIDEAFGRGSDVSTRYALDLFAKLRLQLLIVTPLQKVHVIEPYVQGIGFVDNPDGNESRLHNLTVEEYRTQNLRGGAGASASGAQPADARVAE